MTAVHHVDFAHIVIDFMSFLVQLSQQCSEEKTVDKCVPTAGTDVGLEPSG